jgi:riboflavin kinase/FMN adenylyltransferase
MEVIHGWNAVPAHLKGASIAIGTFDGFHRGHQAVAEAAKAKASELQALAGVMVFEPYPRMYFQPGRSFFRLTTLPRKLKLLQDFGCDLCAVIPFEREVAELTAEDFVRSILVEGFGIRHAAVGFNFFFGKGRGGNPGVLAGLGRAYGFGVTVVEPKGNAGEIFSSTRIREALAEGDVAAAAEMLGYFWRISGVVEGGAGRGQGLGFPTANIRLDEGVTLKHGIYAVIVHVGGEKLQGAAYLGTRPTFDAGLPVLETFLFDFNGNLYGRTIDIEFIAFVRDDAKFKSAEALSSQMAADCAKAKAILDQVQTQSSQQGSIT